MRIINIERIVVSSHFSVRQQITVIEADFERELIKCQTEEEMDKLVEEYHQTLKLIRSSF